jgi:hypothetical protein
MVLLSRSRAAAAVCALLLMVGFGAFGGAVAAAQSLPGTTITTYGYFADNGATVLTLVHLEADDPSLAGEMVSPRYADDFFSGFSIFTNYDFASDLGAAYIDQIDEADEYMVFKGNLDFYDGVKPGYVIMLSTSQEVFMMVGYQADADDLFDLAETVIARGDAPAKSGDFTRVELTEDSGSSGSSRSNVVETDRLNEFCYVEPAFAPIDENGDGLLTVAEIEQWVSIVPELQGMLDSMDQNGFDAIRYVGC